MLKQNESAETKSAVTEISGMFAGKSIIKKDDGIYRLHGEAHVKIDDKPEFVIDLVELS